MEFGRRMYMAMPITHHPAPDPSPMAASTGLENGDWLTREDFERRYRAMPALKRAELIEGRVYISSPVSTSRHGQPHVHITTLAGIYCVRTPGVGASDNGSIRLDADNMPQPDLALFIDPARGGRVRLDQEGYIEGPPDLIVEVAASSVSYDLHDKLSVYRRSGVNEYLVWRIQDQEFDWFRLHEGRYVPMPRDEAGVHRSEVFPGFWIDTSALLKGDLAQVHQVLAAGLNSPEHASFVERLAMFGNERSE